MGNTLYLECYSGISGDMMAAMLLDLGANQDVLEKALKSLPVDGFQIQVTRVKKNGLDACDFCVLLDQKHENHDHDMEYLHSLDFHKHFHGETLRLEEEEEQPPIHRGMKEIVPIIEKSDISPRAKHTAISIFQILAQAEAKAHGVPVDQVHFHEVGAVDSIVDIVAVAVCLDDLNITRVAVSKMYEGYGTVRCQHGMLPIPVPAVVNIVQEHGLPLCITQIQGELITPTGAAIVAAIRNMEKLPGDYQIRKIGLGAGKRNYDCPGVLRGMLLEKKKEKEDEICKLETNIDDSTGEILGYTMEKLLEAGARDVYYVPIYMKKNRPAVMLCVICSRSQVEKLEEIIFRETTTIGIRRIPLERTVLERESKVVDTSFGKVKVKVCKYGDRAFSYPEFESVRKIARERRLPYRDVVEVINRDLR